MAQRPITKRNNNRDRYADPSIIHDCADPRMFSPFISYGEFLAELDYDHVSFYMKQQVDVKRVVGMLRELDKDVLLYKWHDQYEYCFGDGTDNVIPFNFNDICAYLDEHPNVATITIMKKY